ncbi:SRPBCC family protein [uncultured Cellulomonas sp.]|uniref:SRPBCC family protein n=1 Tax=uncultured Cellulomonas sp. TaxID=189682 RepID=UPI0026187B8D|nr:SRPBCC family protein [uncultured Cellulomonas sp.]
MPALRFVSSWHLPGTAQDAWDAVVEHPEQWPSWWPAVQSAQVVETGDDDGVGRRSRYRLRAPLGYRLAVWTRITQAEPPRLVVVDVAGQLAGTGRWELVPEPGGVRVDQEWEVAPTRRWMRLLAPVATPAFRWSHDRAARRGEQGLARWLAAGPRRG